MSEPESLHRQIEELRSLGKYAGEDSLANRAADALEAAQTKGNNMTQVLILPFERPPKGLAANDRCHWSTRNRSTKIVRAKVCAWGESTVEPSPRLQVELVWVVKDRRKRDEDNLWPMLKAVCDGLGSDRGTSARLVADDSPEFMVKLAPRITYRPDADTPHFEVRVTRLDHE